MKIDHFLNLKTCLVLATAMTSMISTGVGAGDIDLSEAQIVPTGQATVTVYGVKYAPTPDVLYSADYVLNELTRQFELVLVTEIDSSQYEGADIVRGGLLYDKWWKINEQPEPDGNYTRYPDVGSQSGSTTWRCKECHGWDYKGYDGAYQEGSSHYTGIPGLYHVKDQPMAYIYGAIVNHQMLSLSEQDRWDLTKFLKEGQVDMNKSIVFTGSMSKLATGDVENGRTLYEGTGDCLNCHGDDGHKIADVSVGAVANDNPWETLHKIRFGNPGTRMPAMVNKGLSVAEQIDILTYAQTLPQIETEDH